MLVYINENVSEPVCLHELVSAEFGFKCMPYPHLRVAVRHDLSLCCTCCRCRLNQMDHGCCLGWLLRWNLATISVAWKEFILKEFHTGYVEICNYDFIFQESRHILKLLLWYMGFIKLLSYGICYALCANCFS